MIMGIVNHQLSDTLDRFEVYTDEVVKGFSSLARLHRWVTGEEFVVYERGGNTKMTLPEVPGGDNCYIPSFMNAAKAVHYQHEMSIAILHDLVPSIFDAPFESWADDEDASILAGITDEKERYDFLRMRGISRQREGWMMTLENSKTRAGIILNITSKLKTHFIGVMDDVKYGGEIETKDVKKYLDKNTKLKCKLK